jgi:hypothetical protein
MNKIPQVVQNNMYQNILGKRAMKDRTDAQDSNQLHK